MGNVEFSNPLTKPLHLSRNGSKWLNWPDVPAPLQNPLLNPPSPLRSLP